MTGALSTARRIATVAACALTVAGCACNSLGESEIGFHCRWETPAADVEGAIVDVCLNSECSTGAFGSGGSASASATQLSGDLGYLTATLAADPIGAAVSITRSGGNGSYRDGDVWTITITPPAANAF